MFGIFSYRPYQQNSYVRKLALIRKSMYEPHLDCFINDKSNSILKHSCFYTIKMSEKGAANVKCK